MKKLKGNFLKVKKVLYNREGQALLTTSFLSNKAVYFYQFISTIKGS